MNFIKAILSVRKVLGILTDILNKGREAGLWQTVPNKGVNPDTSRIPENYI